MLLEANFYNFEHAEPSWGHLRLHTKFGPDRFSRFDVYLIQTTNRQIDRQAKFIYRYICKRRAVLYRTQYHALAPYKTAYSIKRAK